MAEYIEAVKALPGHMRPKYGTRVIEAIYNKTVQEIMNVRIRDDFFKNSVDPFAQKLALAIF